jgi:uncharacterized protein with PIN domain
VLRFVADDHAGKLARWLRLLGYDTLHFPAIEDQALAELAAREGRIVLTRDTTLAQRFPTAEVFRLEDEDPFRQLVSVVRQFSLDCESGAFTRCMTCNAPLETIDKETCRDEVPPRAFASCREFARCTGCGNLYWDGTHYLRMKERLASLGL